MFAFLFPAAKPETSVRIKSLAGLEAGETGRVVEVQAREPLALHILEIGLVTGAKVRYLRSAPLGGPIQVEVDGFLLSLRNNEAEAVLIETDE
ncbi:MAG: FeoA family protein [Limisphaerales bacterium]